MSRFFSGYVPNPSDVRDTRFDFQLFKTARVRVSADDTVETASYKVLKHKRPIRNQVGGSCVGNAWCNAVELIADNDPSYDNYPLPNLSEQGLYWCARQRQGNQSMDVGTTPRAAASAFMKVGVGPRSKWPSDIHTINAQPPNDWFVAAFDQRLRIEAFYNIQSTGGQREADVVFAINESHPVVLGIPVDDQFMNYRGEGGDGLPLTPPTSDNEVKGWHAVVIIGYRFVEDGSDVLFKILNSWGDAWGIGGTAWITGDYLQRGIDLHVPTFAAFQP